MGPNDEDVTDFIILKSSERQFHYTGQEHIAGEWLADNMNGESHAYIITEYRALRELGKIMCRIPRDREDEVISKMLLFRYFMYEINQGFMLQYVRNMAQLKIELEKLTK